MTQTASVLYTEQSLYITESETISTPVQSEEKQTQNFSFSENHLVSVQSTFYYKERVRLQLTIAEELKPHFILIIGLIDFYRSKNIKVTFYRAQQSLEADLEVTQLEALDTLLANVHHWLLQELQFKAALKKVIEFENRYKAETIIVYDMLRSTVPTPAQIR